MGSSQSQYYSPAAVKELHKKSLNTNDRRRYKGALGESFDMLRNVIQSEIDKINIGCIMDAVRQNKKIYVDANMKDLRLSQDVIKYNYVDHYIMFRGVRRRIRSSANLSFNYRYMDKIEHTFVDGNYIYPNQIYMNNVINYLNEMGIQYYTYDPQTFTNDDVYIGCETAKVDISDKLKKRLMLDY